ncbi:MAG: DNA polymerase subunit beta [uncultured bacterium]|nr:MAG: DNA polymerase subunit beta [uncultured bacterium]
MKQLQSKNNWEILLNKELEKIVDSLKQKYRPDKIILFGSAHDGNIREWSDLDLVIIKKTDKRFYDRISEVSRLIPHRVPVDLLIYTPEEFASMMRNNYFIRDEIVAKGKIIYAR